MKTHRLTAVAQDGLTAATRTTHLAYTHAVFHNPGTRLAYVTWHAAAVNY